ncbi:hypothetical protein [Campylobacter sp. CN_NA1]|uniref:hypothetical protein n=1 Tax=Campylobacter sp. CN_NA1 TaxID=2984150 RepID=UPI0022E9A33D|nr:hypothetical protein [Campylobacter sp. CN_NA1]MDA3056441.1 hypothetical protein [Campylobacter sp. CN_NA1]
MNLSVLYSQELSDFAKILYFEIENLAKKKGFCYASIEYFRQKFPNSKTKKPRSVGEIYKTLAELKEANLIKTDNKNKQISIIKNSPNGEKNSPNGEKNSPNGEKNSPNGENSIHYMNSEVRIPKLEYSDCKNFSQSQHAKNNSESFENKIQNTQSEKNQKTQKPNSKNSQIKNSNFIKPTLSELKKFVYEAGLKIDCEHFYDYYEANGWLVGNKAKMRDWKACVRNWARNNAKFNSSQKKTQKEQNAEVMSEWDRQMDEREFYESCDNAKATHNNAQNDLYEYCDDFVEAEILTKGA